MPKTVAYDRDGQKYCSYLKNQVAIMKLCNQCCIPGIDALFREVAKYGCKRERFEYALQRRGCNM
jgi:hypothetical protein